MIQPPTSQVIVSAQGEGATAVGPRGVNVVGDVYGSIITGDTYNYYFEGTRFYMPDFTTAVKNFLYNYLGDQANPVPFGGRADALVQLEQWRTQADAPPRLLLTAPAGRGKSALLVRWSAYLQAQQDVAVVFMPISIRFNTNQETDTFSLPATRLAHLYGKEIPAKWGNFPASAWRRLVAEYLQEPLPDGRHLLLIMDGLDEAAWDPGADIFPHQLPERVRLVVSARYRGGEEPGPGPWLRLLDWDNRPQMAATLELKTLTQTGVRGVLERMGCPLDELSQNFDIVTELYCLSEGDPLLVELYVKDLWQRGEVVTWLKPEDLREIQPGYEGYFEKWWADQEKLWGQDDPLAKDLVNDVLDVLSMALGPLTTSDLRQLLPGNVRNRDLKRAVRPLNRFVIGDGQEQGYAFAHPKLGEYFRDQLEPDEQAEWQASFLAWGEQTLADLRAKKVQPRDVPRYLMLYYGRHLEKAKVDVVALLPLVSWEWIQVWHEKTGTYAGFLQDVDRVWLSLRLANGAAIRQEGDAPFIGQEILCALCHTSVNSLADIMPNKLLASLLQYKLWTEEQVMTYIWQRNNIEKRAKAFASVSPYLSTETRVNVWKEIMVPWREIKELGWLPDMLVIVASYFPEEVLAVAREINDEGNRAKVFVPLAPYLPKEVLAEANELRDETHQAEVFAAVAQFLPDETLTLARKIEDTTVRANILTTLIPYLSESRRFFVIKEALVDAKTIYPDDRAYTLVNIAQHLTGEMRAAVLNEALADAESIRYDDYRADAMVEVALSLTEDMRITVLEEALNLREGYSEAEQVGAFVAVAPHHPDAVLMMAQEINGEEDLAKVLTALAPHLPKATIDAARKIQNGQKQANVLVTAIPYLPEDLRSTILESAFARVQVINDERNRAEMLCEVASYLPEEALIDARDIYNEKYRAEVLVSIAPFLPAQVLETAREISDEKSRAKVLMEIVSHLPEEALIDAQKINSEEYQAKVLMVIAPYLPYEVLEVAEEIDDLWTRVEVFMAVAPYLPKDKLEELQGGDHAWNYAEVPAIKYLSGKISTETQEDEDRKSQMEMQDEKVSQTQSYYELWQGSLTAGSKRTRPDILSTINTLMPITHWLGGETAVRDTWQAVQTVSTWWP